jgi:hypothetical protein
MELSTSGDKISAKLLSDKGVPLCSLLISKWLPIRPPFNQPIPLAVPLKDGDRVVVTTFCSSNICYVQHVERYEQQCRLYNEVNILNYTGIFLIRNIAAWVAAIQIYYICFQLNVCQLYLRVAVL